jgi:DNA-binding transcriptional LysR family regulator
VRCHVESQKLVRILTDYPSEVSPIYAVYLQNRHLSANVRVFVDWVVELFKQEQQRYLTCCPR